MLLPGAALFHVTSQTCLSLNSKPTSLLLANYTKRRPTLHLTLSQPLALSQPTARLTPLALMASAHGRGPDREPQQNPVSCPSLDGLFFLFLHHDAHAASRLFSFSASASATPVKSMSSEAARPSLHHGTHGTARPVLVHARRAGAHPDARHRAARVGLSLLPLAHTHAQMLTAPKQPPVLLPRAMVPGSQPPWSPRPAPRSLSSQLN